MNITKEQIQDFPKYYRANFINSLSGFKSSSLIGTKNKRGITNLALFSSVIHVGANPPLMGFLVRPASVPRHTYSNIKETEYFTINHVNYNIFDKAHITSARFHENESEFVKSNLTEEYQNNFYAPFVKESKIKIALKFVEEKLIEINQTIFVIGEILEIHLSQEIIGEDGSLNIESAETVAISGLSSYHKTKLIEKLPYAKSF